jgi:signal transduction histidine kinase/DNA-binding NarL/FixJ family response regulator
MVGAEPQPVTRVLLVEDNPGDARLLREHLDRRRFELTHVDRVAEAQRVLESQTFDVVLLDLSLPDGAGLETVTTMLRAAPTLPVVVLTGTDDETLALRTVQAGAQDYLVKGAVSEQLIERTIRYAIERRRALETERRHAEAASLARRSRFLVESGRALAQSLDVDRLVATIGEWVVPTLGDVCLVEMADAGAPKVVGVAPAVDAEAARAVAAAGPRRDDDPSVRDGRVTVTPIDDVFLARLPREAERQAWRTLGAATMMTAPLVARGRRFGALSVIATRPPDHEAQSLLEELAQHAALALDNALLFGRQQQAVRARDDMVNVVSHDLRTPLHVMTMTTALLKRELHADPRMRYVERIERSTEQMTRLISDLLDVARIESGTLAVETAPHAVDMIIASASDMLKPLAMSRSLALTVSIARGLPLVSADRPRILQVLTNLVGNAIKFTPPGGRIDLSAALQGDRVRFEVRDSGPGIAAEHLPRVFDRFWQARRNDSAGAGLGLAIAKAIVEAHGGTIGVESEVGAGCCFHFSLPVAAQAGDRLAVS